MPRIHSMMLFSCRSPFLDDSKVYPPLANLYLKAFLNVHRPNVVVTLGDDDYDVSNLEAIGSYDLVGISILTPQRQEASSLAQAIKARWPNKVVVAGGPHVRHYSEALAAEKWWDFLVPADGERALLGIVDGCAEGKIVFDRLTSTEVAALPRPDRTSDEAQRVLRRYCYYLGSMRATTMMTARGCPEQCTFCEDASSNVRRSSETSLQDEIADIADSGYGGVYIFDDVFALSPKLVRPICAMLNRRILRFRCNVQARYFTRWGDEMARILAEGGCYEVAFGAESGSQAILDNVRKRCTVEQNYRTVDYAKRYGIKVKAFIMLGLPGETWQTLSATEAFIRDSGCDDYQFAVYMPFRGTAIRTAIERGDSEVDLKIVPLGYDGDVSGAYGTKGGESAYEVRTRALSQEDIRAFRDYLVKKYRPISHRPGWNNKDHFFEIAEQRGSSLPSGGGCGQSEYVQL